uniref:Chromatin assembly factor 1 subunit B n=1 Tax=Romanomermis culicivorax TaxID=13658 RepID=A0A915HUL5_ROMCU
MKVPFELLFAVDDDEEDIKFSRSDDDVTSFSLCSPLLFWCCSTTTALCISLTERLPIGLLKDSLTASEVCCNNTNTLFEDKSLACGFKYNHQSNCSKMHIFTPEISWHSQDAIFAVDVQNKISGSSYRVATAGIEKVIKIWKIRLPMKSDEDIAVDFLSNLRRHQSTVNAIRFSPDGSLLASGDSEGVVNIWKMDESTDYPDIFKTSEEDEPENLENWIVKKRFREHKAESDVCDMCWSPDSKYLLTCSSDSTIIVWDMLAEKKHKLVHENSKRFSLGIAWDPKNEYFVTMSNDRFMSVYSTINYQKLNSIVNAKLPSQNSPDKAPSTSKLFHDTSLMSYVRRPSFSPDGQFFIAPAGCVESGACKLAHRSFIFSRANMKQPCVILPSPKEATIVVSFCPLLFKLRPCDKDPLLKLPYRFIYAILTKKSVVFYDTQHVQPLAFVTNIHYIASTLHKSKDGKFMIVSSEDGYCTIIATELDSFGEIYVEVNK